MLDINTVNNTFTQSHTMQTSVDLT